jgi:hypothetical protein
MNPSLFRHAVRWLAPFVATLAFVAAALPALAATLNDTDEKDVRDVVQAQLAAFAADDADKAFSYAAPNIREMFVTSSNFITMVRRQYAVVYRPASVAFLKPETHNGEVVQRVQMSDANAVQWLAIYTLQQQANKTWLITGCVLTPNTGRMV